MPARVYFKIPYYKALLAGTRGWKVKQFRRGMQATSPEEPVLEKLGLKKGERILVIAGGLGNWARALAEEGAEVHFSDASREVVNWVRERRGKIKKNSTADALRWPAIRYDWVFSFEPHPLRDSSLPFTLLRSLAKTRGTKLVYRKYLITLKIAPSSELDLYKRVRPLIRFISINYGAVLSEQKKEIFSTTYLEPQEKRFVEHKIITLESNPEAARKAELDLQIISLLQRKQITSVSKIMQEERIKRMKATRKEILESIKRINDLTQLLRHPDDFRKPVSRKIELIND